MCVDVCGCELGETKFHELYSSARPNKALPDLIPATTEDSTSISSYFLRSERRSNHQPLKEQLATDFAGRLVYLNSGLYAASVGHDSHPDHG